VIFRMTKDAFVMVPATIHDTMKRYTVGLEGETEAGGIFIGGYRGNHIQITDCTEPMGRDVRKRYLFDRKDPGHRLAAMVAWTKSFGTETFVGEWHTHPEDFPTPSLLDQATWNKIMGKRTLPAVFIIAGREGLWAGFGQQGRVTQMPILS